MHKITKVERKRDRGEGHKDEAETKKKTDHTKNKSQKFHLLSNTSDSIKIESFERKAIQRKKRQLISIIVFQITSSLNILGL